MATAYAAFTSLMHLISQLQKHPQPPIKIEEKQNDALSSNIHFFQGFLEDHHSTIDHELEIRIADAAHAAEDLIETHIADRVDVDFYRSLQRVIEQMNFIKDEVIQMNLNEQKQQGNSRSTQYPAPHASSQSTSGGNVVVGIEGITINIVEKLTFSQQKSGRQIISISGMGGIGKTTLASQIYDSQHIKDYFDFRAWATISKDYNTNESLLEILHCLDKSKSKESLSKENENNLGEQVHKFLLGRRYLIVLDDVWDLEAWEKMKTFFPDSKGSGIVITTREAKFSSISLHIFRMDLLDEDNSWDLFCKRAFGQDCCPVELENVGKKIAKKCAGLPLSIVVIGSHLAKSPRTPEYWENVSNNISSVDEDRCLEIVSLSYTRLPVHLKSCFLYLAIFPEDEEIRVSRLIWLLVAEGIVKPIDGKGLESAALDYLNDLYDRNLILASWSSLNHLGVMRKIKIHDLLRDFCIKEASKKKFICTVQKSDDLRVLKDERRMVIYPSALREASTMDFSLTKKQETVLDAQNEPKVNHHFDISIALKERAFLRTLILPERLPSLENKLLRVLAPRARYLEISDTGLQEVLHRMVSTRYIDFQISKWNKILNLSSSISRHWNLQYLIITNIDSYTKAPPEFWKMPLLRRIKFHHLILPHPLPSDDIMTMENLRSARNLVNFGFSEEVVKRIPNITKLVVGYDADREGFDGGLRTLNNVNCLKKLESFSCFIYKQNAKHSHYMLRNLTFPSSLKELTVGELHWDDVTTKIGSLLLLEQLQLHHCEGDELKLVEGQFLKLKILDLYSCRSLRCFTANNSHFPCLEELVLFEMDSLMEISSEVGDISTLRSIKLDECPDSAVISAKEISVEQNGNGNVELQVSARLVDESTLTKSFSDTECNFHIELYDEKFY